MCKASHNFFSSNGGKKTDLKPCRVMAGLAANSCQDVMDI